jgi:hypothetical protein
MDKAVKIGRDGLAWAGAIDLLRLCAIFIDGGRVWLCGVAMA